MTNVPLTYFVFLLLFLSCSFTNVLKGGRAYAPWGIWSSKCLWRTDWTSTQYPKVLDLPEVVFLQGLPTASRADDSICRAVVLLCDRAHGVSLSRLAKDMADPQCDSVPLLKLLFHQWKTHIWPQSFPEMGTEHKVNSCSFCLLCLKETVFPQYRKMLDHTLLSHC